MLSNPIMTLYSASNSLMGTNISLGWCDAKLELDAFSLSLSNPIVNIKLNATEPVIMNPRATKKRVVKI